MYFAEMTFSPDANILSKYKEGFIINQEQNAGNFYFTILLFVNM